MESLTLFLSVLIVQTMLFCNKEKTISGTVNGPRWSAATGVNILVEGTTTVHNPKF